MSTILPRELPWPCVADIFYLAAYPFYFAAVLRLGRRANGRRLRERQADAAIICLGALALLWHLVIGAYATTTH